VLPDGERAGERAEGLCPWQEDRRLQCDVGLSGDIAVCVRSCYRMSTYFFVCLLAIRGVGISVCT